MEITVSSNRSRAKSTQRNLHENDESKTTLPFFCYHHLCVRYSSVLHWVSKSWIRVEQSEEKIKRAWKQPGDKPPSGYPNIVKIIKDARGMYIVFFLSYAAFIHSLKLNKYWWFSYHPEKNILQDSTMINFVYLPCILITIFLRLSGLNQWAKCAWTFVFFCLFVCWLRFKRLRNTFLSEGLQVLSQTSRGRWA